MTTRTKTLGLAAAIAAIAVSIPTSFTAYADDPTPSPAPAATSNAVPSPVAPIPDAQGPGCDAFRKGLPATGVNGMAAQTASAALASIPDLSTFSGALSGQANPAVNLVSVLDNGPYIVFAPTNAAFEAMEPGAWDALKADPVALTKVLYYHMALGILGPDDIHGKLTTQQGKQITVTGKGGDLKFDDTAKVVCGGITAKNAKIYMIDTVLTPDNALPANPAAAPTTTAAEATPVATTSAAATESAAAPKPAS